METIPTLSVLYKNRLIPSVVPNCMIILSWDNFNWRVPNAFSKTSKLPDPCSRITNGILFSSSIVIYNPETTLFLQKAARLGCKIKNGIEMLHLQALAAWKIWNE